MPQPKEVSRLNLLRRLSKFAWFLATGVTAIANIWWTPSFSWVKLFTCIFLGASAYNFGLDAIDRWFDKKIIKFWESHANSA